MSIIISPLEKALASLKKAWNRSFLDLSDEELRDACILRFEYTFELSWKLLKRQIELEIEDQNEVDSYSKRTLFRVGGERGLIKNVENWFNYLDKRNLTSHTYNEINARKVYECIGDFIIDADNLLFILRERDDKS